MGRNLRHLIVLIDDLAAMGISFVEQFQAVANLSTRQAGQRLGVSHMNRRSSAFAEGFRDPAPPGPYSNEKAIPGVRLQNRRWSSGWGAAALELQVPTALIRPYETTEPGYVPRVFWVPAAVLNGAVERGIVSVSVPGRDL